MANRAHLFFGDAPQLFDFRAQGPNGEELFYMDSRHTIPYLWALFFEPRDIEIGAKWQGEIRHETVVLSARWPQARALFLRRLGLLRPYLAPLIENPEEILGVLDRFEKAYLLLEANEIFQFDEAASWRLVLEAVREADDDAARQHAFLMARFVCLRPDYLERNDLGLQFKGAWYD